MAAPTILRFKRCKNEDPSEVLVLSAKKRKADDDIGEVENIKILKLAATVDDKDDPEILTETVNKILSKKDVPHFEELKARYKKAKIRSLDQARFSVEEFRQESRFRFVAQKRALETEDPEIDLENENINFNKERKEKVPKVPYQVFDVVNEDAVEHDSEKEVDTINCNTTEGVKGSGDAKRNASVDTGCCYVYDVYYTQEWDAGESQGQDFDESLLDGLVSIQPFNTGDSLVYEDYREDPECFKYEDDIDSNDEDNERNEYPDEDDDGSSCLGFYDDDSELDVKVKGLDLCSEERSDISSDDEDQLLYTRSFYEDAANHGSAYVKYKQNMIKEFYDNEDNDDVESDDE